MLPTTMSMLLFAILVSMAVGVRPEVDEFDMMYQTLEAPTSKKKKSDDDDSDDTADDKADDKADDESLKKCQADSAEPLNPCERQIFRRINGQQNGAILLDEWFKFFQDMDDGAGKDGDGQGYSISLEEWQAHTCAKPRNEKMIKTMFKSVAGTDGEGESISMDDWANMYQKLNKEDADYAMTQDEFKCLYDD
eukprot:TRINITY_DN77669_c0_g1_i1.p1 TRINITY_DN77669_c0_g1~~TRINITY_DN77669_c0_g1_i1.p1  ORF type:complete len:193 (-),score=54.35 TRINITY_DN77669_c0_g1_i1:123-701(-)